MIPEDESIVIDTNVLVAYIRGNRLAEHIENQFGLKKRATKPIICIVSKGEIFKLAEQFGWQQAKRAAMSDLLSDLIIAPIKDEDVVLRYAQISHYLSSLKPSVTIQQNDMWIAAIASCIEAHVITTDKDYQRLDGTWIKLHWIDETIVNC